MLTSHVHKITFEGWRKGTTLSQTIGMDSRGVAVVMNVHRGFDLEVDPLFMLK